MYRFLLSILLLPCVLPATPLCASPGDGARVFIVASYACDNVCGGPQEEGALRGLAKNGWFEGVNLEVRRHYMDTKSVNTTGELMAKEGARVLAAIEAFRPRVVITLDDNAFREVGLKLAGRDDVAVVFSGLNGQPETYDAKLDFMRSRSEPGGNVTGVYEKLYVVNSLQVMATAVPGLAGNKVVGIIDDSPTGSALKTQFERELEGAAIPVSWDLRRVSGWEEYRALIRDLNADDAVGAIYPIALTLKTADGGTITAIDIFRWTLETSRKPEMALNYHFSRIGLFGGVAVDFERMGILAGKQAGRILNGDAPGDIPIEDAPDYAIVFNVSRAAALGLTIPPQILTAADHVYR